MIRGNDKHALMGAHGQNIVKVELRIKNLRILIPNKNGKSIGKYYAC